MSVVVTAAGAVVFATRAVATGVVAVAWRLRMYVAVAWRLRMFRPDALQCP